MELKIIAVFLIAALALPFLCSAARAASHGTDGAVTLHYHRPDGDYGDWKIWSWSDPEGVNAELEQAGVDDFGAYFKLDASKYGASAVRIGLLPKFRQWEGKDDPNRFVDISALKGGNKEIYIVSGKKEVFAERPDVRPFVKHAFLDAETEVVVVLSKKITAADAAALKITAVDRASGRNFAVAGITLVDDNGAPVIEPAGAVERRRANRREGKYEDGRRHRYAGAAGEPHSHFREFDNEKGPEKEPAARSNIVAAVMAEPIKFDFGAGPPPRIEISADGFLPARLKMRGILYSDQFRYDGELGCIYTKHGSTFSVFAPTASAVAVVLYPGAETPEFAARPMTRERGGVWRAEIEGDLAGKYYKYRVTIDGETWDGLDPYSKCNTAHNGRGLIIDDRTHIADPPSFPIDRAVIYEMHIRDFTIDEKTTVRNRGKFLGVAEENTVHADDRGVKTGIAHLRELGVNTVQILPFQDFENDEKSEAYNWGYMPVSFNSPDGWYATETADGSRVAECKKMIDAFHRNGMKVVMDVVYNHTAEGNEMVRHNFNAMAPNYYYRVRLNGDYWNGSGCGNEFKSESYMGRKFIIDSLKYWVREYKVDGFRFDLMGLMDTETVYLLTEELKKIRPDIFIYGEPWAAGAAGIEPTVKGAQRGRGFGVFNDIFRDAIKGSVWDDKGGYVQGTRGVEIIERGVTGSILDFADSPLESINYCEAHDNRTLYDTLFHTTAKDMSMTSEKIERMHRLACFLVLTSQGVPFLHAGQEMMRSKDGEENSYNKPDSINRISWDLKIENARTVELVRELIALRAAHPMLRMKTAAEIYERFKFFSHDLKLPVAPKCLAYMIERGTLDDPWKAVAVLANPRRDTVKFILPEENWKVFYHQDRFCRGAGSGRDRAVDRASSSIELGPISAAILYLE